MRWPAGGRSRLQTSLVGNGCCREAVRRYAASLTQFVQAGLAPPLPLVESTSIRLNYELIRTSDMVGVMTADAAAGYAAQRKLALLPINLESHLPAVGAIMLPGRMSNAMGLYLRVLRESCG